MEYKLFINEFKNKIIFCKAIFKNLIKSKTPIGVNLFPSVAKKNFILRVFLLIIISISNCTTVGFHDSKLRQSMDFGEEQTINVCVFYEDTISKSEVTDLERDWAQELALYKIKLQYCLI